MRNVCVLSWSLNISEQVFFSVSSSQDRFFSSKYLFLQYFFFVKKRACSTIMQIKVSGKLVVVYLIELCFLLNITDNAQWNSHEESWVTRASNIYQKIYYNYNKPFIQWTIRRQTQLMTTHLQDVSQSKYAASFFSIKFLKPPILFLAFPRDSMRYKFKIYSMLCCFFVKKKVTVFFNFITFYSNTFVGGTFFAQNIKGNMNGFSGNDADRRPVTFVDSGNTDWKDATLDDPLSYFLFTSSTLTGLLLFAGFYLEILL